MPEAPSQPASSSEDDEEDCNNAASQRRVTIDDDCEIMIRKDCYIDTLRQLRNATLIVVRKRNRN